MFRFEYDKDKSAINAEKHGIDFKKAQRLWDDPDFLEIQVQTQGESRYLIIGRIDGKHWSAVITYREGVVRLISVRRSRKKEVALYES